MSTTERTRGVARGGVFALLGAIISATAGFALTLVLGRTLGAAGLGVVLQAIAAFTIAMGIGRAGLDTTAVWLLPRVADEARGEVRAALTAVLTLSFLLGLGTAVLLWASAPFLTGSTPALSDAARVMTWTLPFATLMTVALAATRGLGGVRPYVLIGNIAVPGIRPLLVWGAVAMGGGAVAAGVVWAIPFPIAAITCLVVLRRLLRRTKSEEESRLPSRQLLSRIGRYTWPRSVASILEQALLWLDVLAVGILAGPVAAGVYGAATRLVRAGMLLSAALRIVVAPHYSRLFGQHQVTDAQSLYTTTTSWIVYFSAPIFITFSIFGGTVLSIFGEDFRVGSTALLLLATGLLLVLFAGNVQAIVLMSGFSGRVAINKLCATVVNVAGLFLLVPAHGIEGAAVAWALAMLVDTALAAWQVQHLIGLNILPRLVATSAVAVLASYGIPVMVTRFALGDTWLSLTIGVGAGCFAWVITALLLRHHLSLDAFGSIFRRSRARESR